MESKNSKNRYYNYLNYQACYEYLYLEPKFCEALAYLLTFKKIYDFKVIPHTSSIEISNNVIQIFIVLTGAFQFDKYDEVKKLKNVHFVSFDRAIDERHEFFVMKNKIKFISIGTLMETVSALTKNGLVNKMQNFKEIDF